MDDMDKLFILRLPAVKSTFLDSRVVSYSLTVARQAIRHLP